VCNACIHCVMPEFLVSRPCFDNSALGQEGGIGMEPAQVAMLIGGIIALMGLLYGLTVAQRRVQEKREADAEAARRK